MEVCLDTCGLPLQLQAICSPESWKESLQVGGGDTYLNRPPRKYHSP